MGKRNVNEGAGQRPAADPRRRFEALVAAYGAGKFEEVARGAEDFTRQWPEQVVGWNLLAEGCRLTGRLDDAEQACRRALAIDPRNAEACNNLGNVLTDRGQLVAAEAVFREALARKPGLVEARYNLGRALRGQGRLREAITVYREAARQRPRECLYQCALGIALKEAGELEGARTALKQALELRPDHAETHNDLGNILRDLGEYEAAVESFRRAILLCPHLVTAHNNLGNLLRAMGEPADAEACIREALRLDPNHVSAWYNLALTRRFDPGDPALASLEHQLARRDLEKSDRALLNFALGKALADAGAEPARVFGHYQQGCCLKRDTIEYSPQATAQLYKRIADVCSSKWLETVPVVTDSTPGPIFVVGMPRSGTTLVEQMLASHPQVHGAGELKVLGRLIAAEAERTGQPYPDWLADVSGEQLRRIGEEYHRLVVDAAPRELVVDKMPSNLRYLGLIAAALPGARMVHVSRHPLDNCLSCYMHHFNESQPFSYDLGELGHYYRLNAQLMSHWRAVLPPGRLLDLSYEELVFDPEPVARRLLAHCELEWDPACLEFHENRRAVTTASTMQVRQPMYQSAVGRWRKYRDHVQPLVDALGPLAPADAWETE